MKEIIYFLYLNYRTMNTDYVKWLNGLQRFIYKTLEPIILDERERVKYVDSPSMAIWSTAFTHESVSPTANYEDLEYLGDAILHAVFPKYLMNRFPKYHKNHYTELNTSYMSKITQARLSKTLGFPAYIRVQGILQATLNLHTDVFESFFGALDRVSDNIVNGLGFVNCYNMIIHLFKDEYIDESKTKGSAKTQVQQIFSRFELGNVIENHIKQKLDSQQDIFIVEITPDQQRFMKTLRKNIPIEIGRGFGNSKKEAVHNAYVNALNNLEHYGISSEWAAENKLDIDLKQPGVQEYLASAKQRLALEGYKSLKFFIPRKLTDSRGNSVVELIGVRQEDNQEEIIGILVTNDKSNSYSQAKADLVRKYAMYED